MVRRFLCALLASIGCAGTALALQVYYADLHSHTGYSDGIGTPAEAYAYARDVAHINVLGITDHTGMLTASEWADELAQADLATVSDEFVGLAAQEFGNLNDFGHIGIYDCLYRNPNNTENLLGTYQFMKDMGAIGNFNHPAYGSNFNNLAFYPQYLDQMTGIEIRNGERTDNYEPQYIQALQNGWHLGPMGNQDNHNGHWGDQGNPNHGNAIYLVGILAESLTKQQILGALRARRFYAMEVRPPTDRIELSFNANGSPMGSSIESSAHLALTVTAHGGSPNSLFNRIELFEDGVNVDYAIVLGNTVSWQFDRLMHDGEHHFYFVRVHQVDGDYAWSSPIWVTGRINPADAAEVATDGGIPRLGNEPNPFGTSTTISFILPEACGSCSAGLEIHDLSGRLVARVTPVVLGPGEHRWTWKPASAGGAPPPAGIYLCRLIVNGECVRVRKLVLAR